MKKRTKNALCVLLCVMLLVPIVLSGSARTEPGLSVYVVSDTHYRPYSTLTPLSELPVSPGDELYYHVNSKSMLTYEADAVIDEFLARFEASDSQILLIPGDLSEDGHWQEHLQFAQKLREFIRRTGKTIFVINGNHDIRTSASGNRLDLEDFLDIYADIGYDKALARHNGTASYTAELDNQYRLIAIDACIYREDGSRISPDLLAWIKQQAETARADGKHLIGMVHHSVLPHLSIQSVAGNMLSIENYRSVAVNFADWGIKYVFTGHGHTNDITTAVSPAGNRITDIETGSLLTYPNAYRVATFTDTSVQIQTQYIDRIDLNLLPPSFNAQQRAAMRTDFVQYSYGYMKAGVIGFKNEIPFATSRIARALDIPQGTPGYAALSAVMATVGEALSLPLYDTQDTPAIDSVEEIAAFAGITLEASAYTGALEIGGAIYAAHYAGDEDLGTDSVEVRLFGQCLNAALAYAMVNLPLSTVNTFLSSTSLPLTGFDVRGALFTKAARQIYAQTAARIILNQLITPVIDSIVTDPFAPGDLDVTLEPYGEFWEVEGTHAKIVDSAYFGKILWTLITAVIRSVKVLRAV